MYLYCFWPYIFTIQSTININLLYMPMTIHVYSVYGVYYFGGGGGGGGGSNTKYEN